MIALYRDGQQAGALAAHQAARSVLVGELGAEPGPELRQLHQQILTADPVLAVPGQADGSHGSAGLAGRPPRRQPSAEMPRQLPGAAVHFVGRSSELAALTGALDQVVATGRTVLISAIAGTAGVGKTTP
jgi:hypothetical protein